MSLDNVYHTFAGTPRDTMHSAHVPAATRMVEPLGHVDHHEMQEGWEESPQREVEILLDALTDAGRDLGPELVTKVRARLMPLSRQVRAELVAVIDDAFEVAPDLTTARQQAFRLLSNAKALEAAKAVWPALPDPATPIANVEPLTPWLAHIDRHCDLALDDRRYLVKRMSGLAPDEAMRLAHRYVEAWASGAAAEPAPQRKTNVGRRAANDFLRRIRP